MTPEEQLFLVNDAYENPRVELNLGDQGKVVYATDAEQKNLIVTINDQPPVITPLVGQELFLLQELSANNLHVSLVETQLRSLEILMTSKATVDYVLTPEELLSMPLQMNGDAIREDWTTTLGTILGDWVGDRHTTTGSVDIIQQIIQSLRDKGVVQ